MCLLLYFKFQSVPSGRPLDLTAQNIDLILQIRIRPFIIAVDIQIYPQHVSISILHMIVQYRAEEQRSPITIVIVPASGEAISAVTVRRKEAGKTAGISLSLSLSRYCISRLIIVQCECGVRWAADCGAGLIVTMQTRARPWVPPSHTSHLLDQVWLSVNSRLLQF